MNLLDSFNPPSNYTSIQYSNSSFPNKELKKDEQVWIVRMPNSINKSAIEHILTDLTDLKSTSIASLMINDQEYTIEAATDEIDNGDLASMSCFTPMNGEMVKVSSKFMLFQLTYHHCYSYYC